MDGPCHKMVRSVSPGLLQAEAKSSLITEVIQATQDSGVFDSLCFYLSGSRVLLQELEESMLWD